MLGTVTSLATTLEVPISLIKVALLYVQEVVTLQKKIFVIFASENEVVTIYYTITIP